MQRSKFITAGCLAAALTIAGTQLAFGPAQPAKEKGTKAEAAQPDHDKMMQEMAQYMNPGDEHKLLAKLVGKWDCVAKFYMAGPDGAKQEMASKGEATFTSELDGRWIRQDFKGDVMGEKFAGFGHSGYDKMKKKYVSTWADTMSTSMMTMTGDYDKATKTLTMAGSMEMPGVGNMKMRHTMVEKDANTYVFTMYGEMGGMPESKEGEITYTRRK